jgi:hypothetical protein
VDDRIFLIRISASLSPSSSFTNSIVSVVSLALELPFPRTQCDFVVSR